MLFKFKDWFFRQFPEWHQVNDVNKNDLGEGTFQRYLRGFGLELDEEVMPYLENWLDIIDLTKTDDKYLPLVAGILGQPPGYDNNNSQYRLILAWAIAIYKIKGTKCAFQLLFGLLGYNVHIVEDKPKKRLAYDQPINYDDDANHYDQDCDYCSCYYLAVTDKTDTMDPFVIHPIPQDKLDALNNIICFLTPINAKFCGFLKSLQVSDVYESSTIQETVDVDGAQVYQNP